VKVWITSKHFVYYFQRKFWVIMKGIDLKAFRKANNLTQEKLGEYLGIKKSFVSTIESGKDPMPKDKLSKLLNNPYGWDVSMLTQPSVADETLPLQEDSLIAELRATIERLENKVDNLNQEIGEKNALIKLLRQGGVESV
jgi:transcriptional regulator with XRE-family HTH domain